MALKTHDAQAFSTRWHKATRASTLRAGLHQDLGSNQASEMTLSTDPFKDCSMATIASWCLPSLARGPKQGATYRRNTVSTWAVAELGTQSVQNSTATAKQSSPHTWKDRRSNNYRRNDQANDETRLRACASWG